jgi:hypothetical protein
MSSLRRVQSSKANGARSKGPSTPAGKERSSLNALRHGLCAKCIVLDHESRENFLILLQQHVDRFQPANEVESGMIEEMCASYWRQRRAWAIETALLNKHIALQPGETAPERMAGAFDRLAAAPTLPLLYRYETRQHLMYQRALRTLIMLRTVKNPNDPSPISEHPSGAANPGCSRVSAGSQSQDAAAPTPENSQAPSQPSPAGPRSQDAAVSAAARVPGKPSAAHPAAPPRVNDPAPHEHPPATPHPHRQYSGSVFQIAQRSYLSCKRAIAFLSCLRICRSRMPAMGEDASADLHPMGRGRQPEPGQCIGESPISPIVVSTNTKLGWLRLRMLAS